LSEESKGNNNRGNGVQNPTGHQKLMPFTSLAAVTFAVMGKFCIPMSTSGPLGFGMLDMILISSKNYVLRALSGYSVIVCYKDD
jgi:hypothetical protein